MLQFSQLNETSLTFGEIVRPDRAYRADLFITKYKSGEPFETTKGDSIVLQYDPAIEKAVRTGNKKGLPKLKTIDGTEIAFGLLSKTAEFGGGRGSGGGSDNTRATESAQCVYAQLLWLDPKTNFSPDNLEWAYGKTQVDAKMSEILLGDDQWIASSINGARILHKVLKKKQYTWHRGSQWVSKLEDTFKKLNREEKLFSNVNKWTPADIWAIARGAENKYNIHDAESFSELNNELLKAYAARDIMGISLKKIGKKPKLSQVNFRKPFVPPQFTKQTFGKKNFYGAKDGYLYGSGGFQIQFRTFPTFQCEIIGKKAKHGKVSYGGISDAMKDAVGRPLTQKKVIEQMLKNKPDMFYDNFWKNYSMTSEKDSKETLMANLQKKDFEWHVSKYMVLELFTAIKGREQQVLDYLVRIAKSQTKNSAVHLKVS
tara:strand:+ start:2093 stop:3379 length:1287 start_codon:yes stop_codon:yes gene_type:complete